MGTKSDVFAAAVFMLIAALMFWPWVVGLFDMVSWMATGQQLTSIPWRGSRGFLMCVWPIAWTLVVLMLVGCFA